MCVAVAGEVTPYVSPKVPASTTTHPALQVFKSKHIPALVSAMILINPCKQHKDGQKRGRDIKQPCQNLSFCFLYVQSLPGPHLPFMRYDDMPGTRYVPALLKQTTQACSPLALKGESGARRDMVDIRI